jgi:hypothetical protein
MYFFSPEGERFEAPAPPREIQRPLRYARVNVARASRENVEEELRQATISQKSSVLVTLYRKCTSVMISQQKTRGILRKKRKKREHIF